MTSFAEQVVEHHYTKTCKTKFTPYGIWRHRHKAETDSRMPGIIWFRYRDGSMIRYDSRFDYPEVC